ncbi:MAG TPA: sugar phosphate isomerase/epimerase [Pyrinomonadaceae bacterium]|jgi:sugar phosphate isomerase/epimerase|nr:sugar phosphate isomerase/epimerase [Pyrinomonadaceae bacterium]
MNRRRFLTRALQSTAGVLCLPRTELTASALMPGRLSSIGMQLYTVRRELEKDFGGTLARVAALGYREVEFAGYFNRPPKEVRGLLDRHRLKSPAAHVPLVALRGNLQEMIDAAHLIGHKYLLVAYLPAEERRSLDDYRRHADLFNKAGELLNKAGLRFAYHNHDFEFAPTGGRVPYDLLLELTDPRLVKMEMDLYWTVKGGASPLKYFEKHPGRFHLLHVKDMDATPKRYFTEVGRGVIDFKTVFAGAGRAGVRHYFVEQDETPGPPFDSLKVSMDYLKKLEF